MSRRSFITYIAAALMFLVCMPKWLVKKVFGPIHIVEGTFTSGGHTITKVSTYGPNKLNIPQDFADFFELHNLTGWNMSEMNAYVKLLRDVKGISRDIDDPKHADDTVQRFLRGELRTAEHRYSSQSIDLYYIRSFLGITRSEYYKILEKDEPSGRWPREYVTKQDKLRIAEMLSKKITCNEAIST